MRRAEIGQKGEALCAQELQQRGWQVEDLNEAVFNMPNSDLKISRPGLQHYIQVKSSARHRGYISGGSVNRTVVSGGPIFNRKDGYHRANFIIFISCLETRPRFFVMPVQDAEEIFRKNVSAYFLTPKLDGGVKKPTGQCDIFVGEGDFPHARIVPDQRPEVLPYEDRWDILEHH